MANFWEVVTLERNEIATISLPYHSLDICNLRCVASDFDFSIIIVDKLTAKIAFGNPRTCRDTV